MGGSGTLWDVPYNHFPMVESAGHSMTILNISIKSGNKTVTKRKKTVIK